MILNSPILQAVRHSLRQGVALYDTAALCVEVRLLRLLGQKHAFC